MSLFTITPKVDEAQLAREASEYFTRLYRMALDQIGSESFSPNGEGRTVVKDTFDMRLKSDNTRRVIETACDTVVKNLTMAELKNFTENEELKAKTVKEITAIVHEHQVELLNGLVEESFQPGGVSHKAISEVFAMKMGSQQLMRIIEANVLALVEAKVAKNANAYIVERETEILAQVAPRFNDVLVEGLANLDVAELVKSKIEEVATQVIYEKAKSVADELIGDSILEDVRKRLPHSAVPYVGRVCDTLPFEAILRHYLKKNAMALAMTVIQDLARKMYERRLSKMMEKAADEVDPNMPMPQMTIVTEGNVTTITVSIPGEDKVQSENIPVPDIPSES